MSLNFLINQMTVLCNLTSRLFLASETWAEVSHVIFLLDYLFWNKNYLLYFLCLQK